jgi:hypothetical protein
VPFELKIPPPWRSQGWKVRVRDRERVEPPHVTILHKTTAWRLELRGGEFLDREPDPGRVPHQVLDWVRQNIEVFRSNWDRMYPENPLASRRPDCEDDETQEK